MICNCINLSVRHPKVENWKIRFATARWISLLEDAVSLIWRYLRDPPPPPSPSQIRNLLSRAAGIC